jgi:hypothetical protein
MDHESRMYELEFPAPQLSSDDGSGPVLVHGLEGFTDAGKANWSPRSIWTSCWTTARGAR